MPKLELSWDFFGSNSSARHPLSSSIDPDQKLMTGRSRLRRLIAPARDLSVELCATN